MYCLLFSRPLISSVVAVPLTCSPHRNAGSRSMNDCGSAATSVSIAVVVFGTAVVSATLFASPHTLAVVWYAGSTASPAGPPVAASTHSAW